MEEWEDRRTMRRMGEDEGRRKTSPAASVTLAAWTLIGEDTRRKGRSLRQDGAETCSLIGPCGAQLLVRRRTGRVGSTETGQEPACQGPL